MNIMFCTLLVLTLSVVYVASVGNMLPYPYCTRDKHCKPHEFCDWTLSACEGSCGACTEGARKATAAPTDAPKEEPKEEPTEAPVEEEATVGYDRCVVSGACKCGPDGTCPG